MRLEISLNIKAEKKYSIGTRFLKKNIILIFLLSAMIELKNIFLRRRTSSYVLISPRNRRLDVSVNS